MFHAWCWHEQNAVTALTFFTFGSKWEERPESPLNRYGGESLLSYLPHFQGLPSFLVLCLRRDVPLRVTLFPSLMPPLSLLPTAPTSEMSRQRQALKEELGTRSKQLEEEVRSLKEQLGRPPSLSLLFQAQYQGPSMDEWTSEALL
jgi:hypothetical protein